MATIAKLVAKADGSFEGTLATLSVTAPIAILPNGRKVKDSEPVINTDRRTYHVELRATPATYMASVSWTYPADELIALRAAAAEQERLAPVAAGLDLAALDFRYRISGDKVGWMPLRVFDGGRQTFVEFAEGIASNEMPPIFALNDRGEAELVNYRVNGRYMIVDRILDRAVLRLGVGKAAREVRIDREKARRGRS